MLASDALPVERWLDDFTAKAALIEDEEERKAAEVKIGAARDALGKLNPAADALLAAQAGGATPPATTADEVAADEHALGTALTDVFRAFGGKKAAILNIFATEIEASHPDAKLQLRKALQENDTKFQTMKWAEIRAEVTKNYAPFNKPLLAEHAFGKKAQAAALAVLPEGAVFTTPEQESTFLGQWVARLIHSEGDVFATALEALRTILFEFKEGALENSPELRAAVAEAFKRQSETGEQPDPDLVAEVSGKIIPFLVAVARRDPTFGKLVLENWEQRYWEKPPNKKWLKERFRGSGGKHEWIPTNYVDKVIERGRASAAADDLETAAAWVTFQDELRSPTRIVMYPPTAPYLRTAPYPRDPVSHERAPGGTLTVIQGHVGSVYAPVDDRGYRTDVIGQTQAQTPWHDELRKIFDSNTGTDLLTMRRVVQQLLIFIADNCWFGDPVPNGGFVEYYAGDKSVADGQGLVTFATLQATAAGAINAIDNDFDRAAKAVGL